MNFRVHRRHPLRHRTDDWCELHAIDAVRRIRAERLNVPVSTVKILPGEKARIKRAKMRGITSAQIQALA